MDSPSLCSFWIHINSPFKLLYKRTRHSWWEGDHFKLRRWLFSCWISTKETSYKMRPKRQEWQEREQRFRKARWGDKELIRRCATWILRWTSPSARWVSPRLPPLLVAYSLLRPKTLINHENRILHNLELPPGWKGWLSIDNKTDLACGSTLQDSVLPGT